MDKNLLKQLSNSGQLLSDWDDDVIVELIIVTKMANIDNCDSRFRAFVNLDSALQIYKNANARTSLLDISYQQTTKLFDIKIDKVGLEIISLTMDDLKRLADLPLP